MIINATPHTLNMRNTPHPDTSAPADFDIPPSGHIARVEEHQTADGWIRLGNVTGIPPAAPDDLIVVARPVAYHLALTGNPQPTTGTIVCVDQLLRDQTGTITGATGFVRVWHNG